MAGLTFVPEPRCSRSEPLVHSLGADGPRLTLTPQGHSWGTESPPRSSGSCTEWSHGQTLSCPATKQIKNLLLELLCNEERIIHSFAICIWSYFATLWISILTDLIQFCFVFFLQVAEFYFEDHYFFLPCREFL